MLMISGLVAWAFFSLATPGSVGPLSLSAPSEPAFSLNSISSPQQNLKGSESSTMTKGAIPQSSSSVPSGSSAKTFPSSVPPRKMGPSDDSGSPQGSPVPQPGTLALLGSGLLALAFYRRRGSESHSS